MGRFIWDVERFARKKEESWMREGVNEWVFKVLRVYGNDEGGT